MADSEEPTEPLPDNNTFHPEKELTLAIFIASQ